ncbi:MAG: nucleotide-binding universal stress UspA family protein, partial [Lentisphaeria bacterium]
MTLYSHILVGLDLSEESEAVLSTAQELATRLDAKLSV